MKNSIEPSDLALLLERQTLRTEWQTFLLILGCSISYALVTFFASVTNYISLLLLPVIVCFHSSLQHEALHGHPFKSCRLNELLVFLPIGLFVPYRRFKDTHIEHHNDEILTDPYDDPETNYLDPKVWNKLTRSVQAVLRFNNTLFGRMLIGPIIALVWFYRGDLRKVIAVDRNVLLAYFLHAVGLIMVLSWINFCNIVFWQYFVSAYIGMSILLIRTFLEHRAHEQAKGRSVVIEDHGPFAFLFLNNNFHVVHHNFPGVPWHAMPKLYRAQKSEILTQNDNYVFASYAEIFRKFMFNAKDAVPHPLRSEK